MRASFCPRLVLVLVAVATSIQAGAQDTRFSDRRDRDEGVITTQEISGGYFSLTGLQIENYAGALASVERLMVTFWLPTAERPAIKVWMPRQNY